MNQPRLEPKYLPTLDGWRSVAVFAVMVSHAKRTLISLGLGDERTLSVASWGRLGVDLFFAISGFLITYQLLIEFKANGTVSLKAFYTRRVFRILPLYYAYLIIIAVLSVIAGLPVSRQELLACILFFRNYALPPEGGYTNHFWSLAVEEHFYFLWPMLLVLLKPRRALLAIPPLALAIHCWRSMDARWHLFSRAFDYDTGLIWRTDTRMDALLWGCFAALVYLKVSRMKLPGWIPWLLLGLLPVTIVYHAPALPLILALVFPALIVSTVLCSTGLLGRFLELQPLRWVGRLSYSLYVWQTLFLQASMSADPPWLARLKGWPVNLCLIVLCSVVTHYLLERPLVRLGRKIGQRPILQPAPNNALQRTEAGR
jgi:peptidoglycan/LPS O-acetylase OafA/YrhL